MTGLLRGMVRKKRKLVWQEAPRMWGIMMIDCCENHMRSNLARIAASCARVITLLGRNVPSL